MESTVVSFLFWIFAFIIVASGLLVVILKDIFHCALFLILCLFAVAGLYVLLGADFIAAVQVLLYVGAVAVLLIFAVMLTSRGTALRVKQQNDQVVMSLVTTFVFVLISLYGLWRTIWNIKQEPVPSQTVMSLGKLLLTSYVLPFEIVSVVLLAALIGAVVIARRM